MDTLGDGPASQASPATPPIVDSAVPSVVADDIIESCAADTLRGAATSGLASLALGVHESAHEVGFSNPQDLSVVGFDDSMIAEITTPGLTTVRQPLEDMGGAAVRYLVDVRKGRPTTSGPLRLATQLVTRASTAPPPTQ